VVYGAGQNDARLVLYYSKGVSSNTVDGRAKQVISKI